MLEPFIIEFDFPLEYTPIMIHLTAVAEPVDSSSYMVHSFSHSGSGPGICLLPEQTIKYIDSKGDKSWVHVDSEKETTLSMAIGKAIEEKKGNAW